MTRIRFMTQVLSLMLFAPTANATERMPWETESFAWNTVISFFGGAPGQLLIGVAGVLGVYGLCAARPRLARAGAILTAALCLAHYIAR